MPTSFPVLPLLAQNIRREEDWPVDEYLSISGTASHVIWWSAARYRFSLHYEALRDAITAASPWNAYSERAALARAYKDSRDGTNAAITYTFVDPFDGVTRNVRFDGPIVYTKIGAGCWDADVELLEVK